MAGCSWTAVSIAFTERFAVATLTTRLIYAHLFSHVHPPAGNDESSQHRPININWSNATFMVEISNSGATGIDTRIFSEP